VTRQNRHLNEEFYSQGSLLGGGLRIIGLQIEDKLKVLHGCRIHAQKTPGSSPPQKGLHIGTAQQCGCAIRLRILVLPNLEHPQREKPLSMLQTGRQSSTEQRDLEQGSHASHHVHSSYVHPNLFATKPMTITQHALRLLDLGWREAKKRHTGSNHVYFKMRHTSCVLRNAAHHV
jgi:hypothetical protein